MLFSIGLLIGLVYSGMEGLQLGQPALDQMLHSTYFVVGHFHFTLFMVGVMGLLAGVYYWYPLITGRMYSSLAGKYHAVTTLAGLPLLFFLMARLGELGMMRRYATYTYMPELQFWHILTTGAAFFVASGQLVFFVNMLWSLRYGERVENPWEDVLSGQNMPSPEWDGFPHHAPTPENVYDDIPDDAVDVDLDDDSGTVVSDGGVGVNLGGDNDE
jgi:cytochrome c oxidase subunit 1